MKPPQRRSSKRQGQVESRYKDTKAQKRKVAKKRNR